MYLFRYQSNTTQEERISLRIRSRSGQCTDRGTLETTGLSSTPPGSDNCSISRQAETFGFVSSLHAFLFTEAAAAVPDLCHRTGASYCNDTWCLDSIPLYMYTQ